MLRSNPGKLEKQRRKYRAAHGGKVRNYLREASDRDELGPELVQVELPLRPCIGCGRSPVRGRHYCRRCRSILRYGGSLDGDLPSTAELVRIGVLRPSSLTGGGR